MPPAFSVIIVAWNSAEGLETSIGSLNESARAAGARLEVVVVDNGSSDASVERAQQLGADVVIANPINAGYGVAAAQGLARASAPWALLLNPDVVVERSFVRALADAARSAPSDVATLVPELRFASDRTIVNCRGVQVDAAGIPAEIDVGARVTPQEAPREIFGGSSGACLLRVEAIRAIGGIEPAFFAYMEDVDLAWRLRRAGHRALLVPAVIAYHEGSASLGGDSPLKAFLVARNRRLLFRLNGPRTGRGRTWRTIVELGHASVATVSGTGLAPWLGRFDAVRLRSYISFVRRSRALTPAAAEPPTAPRASLSEAFRRKVLARRLMTK